MTGYLSDIPQEKLQNVIDEIRDFQINNGSLLKLVFSEKEHTVLARPIGVSLFPSPFPESMFYDGLNLQPLFNELYANIAEDEEWLFETTKDLIKTDRLACALWNVHWAAKAKGYAQDMTLGIFRSDYMISGFSGSGKHSSLRQVEFNTYSVAGGSHAAKVARLHEYLASKEVYNRVWDNEAFPMEKSRMVTNKTIEDLASVLKIAHLAYCQRPSLKERRKAILFVVQPNNVNVCDERPIEYTLWQSNPPVPSYRIEFGSELLSRCHLGENRELFFQPDHASSSKSEFVEISVAYMRAGYDPAEYSDEGSAARLLLATSLAINCPSILCHIATFKKVQQALSSSRALSRFVTSDKAASRIKATFMPMYPLDQSTMGQRGRQLAKDPDAAARFILKPSLEGGGHNVYGRAITEFLSNIPEDQWSSFILMETIHTSPICNHLMSPSGLYVGPTVSELGVFGACLWQRSNRTLPNVTRTNRPLILENLKSGWSMKTKPAEMSEMSVVKGYGCFDSLFLVEDLESFSRENQPTESPDDDIKQGLTWYSQEG